MFPLRPPFTYHHVRVAPVKSLTGYKHVIPGAARVGAVALLQDHYHVLHVVVNKVDPEVGPTRGSPRIYLYGACRLSHRPGEGDLVGMGFSRGGGGGHSGPPFQLCCTWQWIASNPTARSILPSAQRTLWRCRAWCVMTSPIIQCPYASTECPPGKDGRPCLLSTWRLSADQPGPRAPPIRQMPVEVLLLAWTRGARRQCRSILPDVARSVQIHLGRPPPPPPRISSAGAPRLVWERGLP